MELGVLGPLELTSGNERIALGGPKQRLVLGLLAARRGRIATIDELIDGLWPEGPQARPRKTLQVYVTRLRAVLGPTGAAIRSEAAGYLLDPALLPVDADAFEADVASARSATVDDRSIRCFRTALGRWRGEAFADLLDCPVIVPSAVYLDELRTAAMYELFEHEVRHRPGAVLGELERAVEANPLHEGFAAQLMRAQYQAGRQADALATYQRLRRHLADELGIDPGPGVRGLEGQILRHELEVAAPSVATGLERQRRRVTVLSAELALAVGLDGHGGVLDPEDELALVAPVHRAARAAILQNAGVVLADAGDGLSACFGYPSYDRSVERAVTAAFAIRDLAAKADPRLLVRIGIDTGVVVIEGPRDSGRNELTGIAGEPLRAATQLRNRCEPGQVMLGPATVQSLEGAVELLDDDASPDADQPRLAVRLLDDRRRVGSIAAGLIGRDAALAELAAVAGRAGSRVAAALVCGPAGIGKSTVVETFVGVLGDAWAVTRLRCDPRQAATPLSPLRRELGDLFSDGTEPSARAVYGALSARWERRQPLVLLEDVHDADPSTMQMLDEIVEQMPAGIVLITSRDEKPIEVQGEVATTIVLDRLDRGLSRRAAEAVAGDRRLPLATLNEIAERSDGVPLYITALTRAVLGGDRHEYGDAQVPVQLYDSLMAALDRLGPSRAVAQQCAVLGGSFTADDLALVDALVDPSTTHTHLSAMVDAGVLDLDGGGRYRFVHQLVADAAHESLLNSERSRMHDHVADALGPEAVAAEPERLAFHLEMAGRSLEAADTWRRASSTAIRRARHREAEHHARRALGLLDALGDDLPAGAAEMRQRVLLNLAVSLQAMSHGSMELLDVIAEATVATQTTKDPGRAMVLGMIDISNRHALGDFGGAIRVARQQMAEAARLHDEVNLAYARQFLGASLVWRGRLSEGRDELLEASAYWQDADAAVIDGPRTIAAMWTLLAIVYHLQDDADSAARSVARAHAIVPESDGYGQCLVTCTCAVIDQLDGDVEAVRTAVEPMWTLAMDLGSDFWLGWAQALLGWATAVDDPAAGIALMTEAVDDAPARQALPYFSYLLGSRLCEHDRHEEGLARLDAGLAMLDDTEERLWEPLLHMARARCLRVMARDDEATEAADAAARCATAMGAGFVARWHAEWPASGPAGG